MCVFPCFPHQLELCCQVETYKRNLIVRCVRLKVVWITWTDGEGRFDKSKKVKGVFFFQVLSLTEMDRMQNVNGPRSLLFLLRGIVTAHREGSDHRFSWIILPYSSRVMMRKSPVFDRKVAGFSNISSWHYHLHWKIVNELEGLFKNFAFMKCNIHYTPDFFKIILFIPTAFCNIHFQYIAGLIFA